MTMFMCDFKEERTLAFGGCTKICITNRQLLTGSTDYTPAIRNQILSRLSLITEHRLADVVLLREKDLSLQQYADLAQAAFSICRKNGTPLVLHRFSEVAAGFTPPLPIHLSVPDFLDLKRRETVKRYPDTELRTIGVSTHTTEEALEAERLGAAYVTMSHIFPTACKPDLPPCGLDYLREVCRSVSIPVYALGGIHPEQIDLCRSAGAAGVCMMSEYFGRNFQVSEIHEKVDRRDCIL